MNNIFEFAVPTDETISKVEEVGAAMMALANIADTVRGTFEKTWAAIETGAHLQAWSSVAGEWMNQLYEFEQGLEAVGRKGMPAIFTDINSLAVADTGEQKNSQAVDAKNIDLVRNHFKPEFTSLEKMGFIMSGEKVQNPYHQRSLDLLQQIVENTKQIPRSLAVPMPDNKHLHDIIDPSPFISNLV